MRFLACTKDVYCKASTLDGHKPHSGAGIFLGVRSTQNSVERASRLRSRGTLKQSRACKRRLFPRQQPVTGTLCSSQTVRLRVTGCLQTFKSHSLNRLTTEWNLEEDIENFLGTADFTHSDLMRCDTLGPRWPRMYIVHKLLNSTAPLHQAWSSTASSK